MSNKKVQKVIVYIMIAAMVASSVLIGLSVFL
ncbi:MAG TPA: stressosome-associated protein Prli42 [Sporosarcina sp.]|nr:stressosome-associated protein Prli42 [Sporosarcina sp.]